MQSKQALAKKLDSLQKKSPKSQGSPGKRKDAKSSNKSVSQTVTERSKSNSKVSPAKSTSKKVSPAKSLKSSKSEKSVRPTAKSQSSAKNKPLLEKASKSPVSKASSKSKQSKLGETGFSLAEICESAKPKKGSSAWVFFLKAQIEKLDDSSVVKVTEVTKKGGELWAAMTEAEKHPYNMLAQADQTRFQREIE